MVSIILSNEEIESLNLDINNFFLTIMTIRLK